MDGLLDKALPFPWIGKGWVVIAMPLILLLVVAGEFLKSAIPPPGGFVLFHGVSSTYVLLFQLALLMTLFFLLLLRTARMAIVRRLVNAVHRSMLTQMREWGIQSERMKA